MQDSDSSDYLGRDLHAPETPAAPHRWRRARAALASPVAWFAAGFLLGVGWAWYAAHTPVEDVDPAWMPIAATYAIESALAIAAFALVAGRRLPASPAAVFLSFVAGLLANVISVGPYSLIPSVVASDNFADYLVSVAALGAGFGWLLTGTFRPGKH